MSSDSQDPDTRTRNRLTESDDVRIPPTKDLPSFGRIDLSVESIELRELREDAARVLFFVALPLLAMVLFCAWSSSRKGIREEEYRSLRAAVWGYSVASVMTIGLSGLARKFPLPAVFLAALLVFVTITWYSLVRLERSGCVEVLIWPIFLVMFIRAFHAAYKYQRMK